MDSSSLEPVLMASLENHLDGILMVRGDRKIIFHNKQFLTMCAIPFNVIYSGDDRLMYRHIIAQLKAPDQFTDKVNYLFKSSVPSQDYVDLIDERRFSVRSFAFNDSTGISRFWIIQDITELNELAVYDRLTKCLNSNMWNKFLADSTKQGSSSKTQELCIAVIDLNNLKYINDRFGHSEGDKTIEKIAETLLSVAREGDKVYRTGGDEFAVIMPSDHDISEKIEERFYMEFVRRGLKASCAVLWKSKSEKVVDVYRQADLKMLAKKRMGTRKSALFAVNLLSTPPPSYNRENDHAVELVDDFNMAIQKQELTLAYQPIFDSSHHMIWCEVLMRWRRARDGKYISPAKFIPIAEKTNKIHDLWAWSWSTALAQLSEWRSNSYVQPKLGFNLSPVQINNTKDSQYLAEQITGWCNAYEIPTQDFYVELTESSCLEDVERAARLFKELQLIGIKLCLDDFGTGFSSLSILKSLPIDIIKIDGSFVSGLTKSHTNQAIVKATTTLASELGIKVVAECVESDKQLKYLTEQGCDYFQGYYFSKPLSSDGLEKILARTVQ